MKYVSEEDLRAHLIDDGCDDGCGYLDERDIPSLPWIELDATNNDVLYKIKTEIEQMSSELTADGRRMVRRGSVFRIIDKYRKER